MSWDVNMQNFDGVKDFEFMEKILLKKKKLKTLYYD